MGKKTSFGLWSRFVPRGAHKGYGYFPRYNSMSSSDLTLVKGFLLPLMEIRCNSGSAVVLILGAIKVDCRKLEMELHTGEWSQFSVLLSFKLLVIYNR